MSQKALCFTACSTTQNTNGALSGRKVAVLRGTVQTRQRDLHPKPGRSSAVHSSPSAAVWTGWIPSPGGQWPPARAVDPGTLMLPHLSHQPIHDRQNKACIWKNSRRNQLTGNLAFLHARPMCNVSIFVLPLKHGLCSEPRVSAAQLTVYRPVAAAELPALSASAPAAHCAKSCGGRRLQPILRQQNPVSSQT